MLSEPGYQMKNNKKYIGEMNSKMKVHGLGTIRTDDGSRIVDGIWFMNKKSSDGLCKFAFLANMNSRSIDPRWFCNDL